MILALALSPSLDVTYEVDRLRLGGITRPDAVTRVAGGKALNMARAACALGAGAGAVAALGGATGDRVAELAARDGVELTVVPVGSETRTCIAIAAADGGATSTDVYERAAAFEPAEWTAFADATRARGRGVRWIALSGSIPAGVPLDRLAVLLSELRGGGARVAVDVSGTALDAVIGSADLVKVNRAEAEEAIGRVVPDAAAACGALHDRFGVDAIVTDGVHGAAALIGRETTTLPAARRRGRFPAGSGDAFLGGLLAALDAHAQVEDALAAAADAAERNALVPGQGRLAPA